MKKILLLATTILITSACSAKSKKTFGLTESMPDEYQVTRNKALEIPPCYQKPADSKKNLKNKNSSNLSKAEKSLLKEVK